MPTTREIVANKPLTGPELSAIMQKDFSNLLQNDGLLGGCVAFGRVSYEIQVIVHMDNFSYPTHSTSVHSRKVPADRLRTEPELQALQTGVPLKDASPLSYVLDKQVHREITSPNVARIENGLPVTIQRRDGSGATTEQSVHYPQDMSNAKGPEPVIKDNSLKTRKEWEIPDVPSCKCEGSIKWDDNCLCTTCGGVVELASEGL